MRTRPARFPAPLLLALGLAAPAQADDAPPIEPAAPITEPPPAEPADDEVVALPEYVSEPEPLGRRRSPYRWGGVVVPTVGYTSTDGVGFGFGASLFTRRRELEFGYRDMLTISTYWAVSGRYTSNMVVYERRQKHFFVARGTYRLWSDMVWTGSGGRDVAVLLPEELTRGNRVSGPSALFTGQFSIDGVPFKVFAQAYGRYAQVAPQPGGLLDRDRPWGVAGGWYTDASVGLYLSEVDRWPLPNKGVVAQASVRGGFSTSEGRTEPIVGLNVEAMGWLPVAGQRLVLAGRGLFDRTWGQRPFYEREWLGGTMRDEVAYEQMLLGYGRTRTRGDGVLAALLEARVWLGRTRHAFADASFTIDAWAEAAWVFDGNDAGPMLPTVGVAPGILWQGATVLRPWAAWGWLSEGPGAPRTPQAQFGLSLSEPL